MSLAIDFREQRDRRASRCPECSARGMVFSNVTRPDEQILRYRCAECAHEWDVARQRETDPT